MKTRNGTLCARLLAGAAMAALSSAAHAEQAKFDIPPQPLSAALRAFSVQSGHSILGAGALADSKASHGISGPADVDAALVQVLADTGLTYKKNDGTYLIVAGEPEGGNVVQELVVTAQKKEEAIQTVPIAISAFSQKSLDAMKIEGGPDLLKAIPNFTFTKTNFTGYSIQIRGIGTQAVSVTTDPAVAVEFNGTSFLRNHFFEQEFFDVERVEVLRGPQGTLYGRNATAGVVNIISAKPTDQFEGEVKAEVGNYQSRRMRAFINIPIIGDKLDLRIAGAATMRDGYAYNATTQNPIDGRDLWSGRVTLGFHPVDKLRGTLVWEHFDEHDDRARSTKQLCHHDSGPASLSDGTNTVDNIDVVARGQLSQGCKPGSMYDAGAFGTPNGLSIPFVRVAVDGFPLGQDPTTGENVPVIKPFVDPYGGLMQSTNLRQINSVKDPRYRAKADIYELSLEYDVFDGITINSSTSYNTDQLYSFEDYNRFNTVPVFNNSSGIILQVYPLSELDKLTPGGIYCDPQIGCSNSIAGFDISQEHSTQFSQEFRVTSSFSGAFNFSAGGNYTRYRTLEDYYVMFNLITLLAQSPGPLGLFNASGDFTKCTPRLPPPLSQADNSRPLVDLDGPDSGACVYIDPNPVDRINGQGHNYFRSENPYRLRSWAGFAEAYYQLNSELKLTAGVRYTDDRKIFTPIPSQILLASGYFLSGTVDRGYPARPDIVQHWGEVTGRFVANWSPKLSFTDQTMIYASYSRGYKGGGANPPGIGFNTVNPVLNGFPPVLQTLSYPLIFKPEFVNAFELGSKNTLMGGALVLNGDVFFYDYKDYQVSQIKERTAVNENFSSKVWGAELESIWQPTRELRVNLALGYEGTRIADGAQSIDLMDRLQGHDDYVVLKPWIQLASNCIVPKSVVIQQIESNRASHLSDNTNMVNFCGGFAPFGGGQLNQFNAPNGGAGFFADVSGNELPNAPHFTTSLGVQYERPFGEDWTALVRADFYWQSQSWARVYNDNPYDKLHGWYNTNLTLDFNRSNGLKIEIYVKNVFNSHAITGSFLNSDDTALTTNVFIIDPRLIGFSITKSF